MAGEIVLGYDASAGARAALPVAVRVAEAFGAPIVVAFGYEPANPVGGEMADLRAAIERRGEEVTAEALMEIARRNPAISTRAELIADRPASALAALAESLEALVIVVGSNGRSRLAKALLGSTSYRVLHEATVPVLVVNPPDDEDG